MTLTDETLDTPILRRGKRTRDAILSAAEKVVSDEGEANLSIRRVAEEIDYSPAAIYRYFRTKTELIDALKEAFFSRILDKINLYAELDAPYAERARRCVAVYILTALETPHHYIAAFSGFDDTVTNISWDEFILTNKGKAFLYLHSIVEEGVTAGELRSDLDTSLTAKSLWASCHGLALLSVHLPGYPTIFNSVDNGNKPVSIEDFIDYHADLMMRGLENMTPTAPTTCGPRLSVS